MENMDPRGIMRSTVMAELQIMMVELQIMQRSTLRRAMTTTTANTKEVQLP
jgi:hypothetical protein